jgi:hypothetical protein
MNDTRAFSSENPALSGIPMEASKKIIKVRPKIQAMKVISLRRLKATFLSLLTKATVERSKLYVSPISMRQISLQIIHNETQVSCRINQRFTVIGERQ